MKKFNPKKEINKTNGLSLESKISFAFIPLLVVACSILALSGLAFSYKLANGDKPLYTIDITVLNGSPEIYHDEAFKGSYSGSISGSGELGFISCESGNIEYDAITERFTIPYLNSNVKCYISFKEESAKYLAVDGLLPINDNDGVSYYYPANSTNNYIKINNMMFRIVRINGDGTLRVILDKSELNGNYGNKNDFMKSNLKNVLNNWYKDNFQNFNKKYIIKKDFDVVNYYEIETHNLLNLDSTYDNTVGTLSVREAALILNGNEKNYLGNILLANTDGGKGVYAILNGQVTVVALDTNYNIKPVLNISDVELDGLGIEKDPYVIKED